MDEVTIKSSGQVEVVRIGDTIRRPMRRASVAVHALLRHLELVGFDGAPRVLGVDEAGREVLSWVHGDAGSPGGEDDERLVSEALLVRRYHDAVERFRLPDGLAFAPPRAVLAAGPLVCHNDLAPDNTVFRGGSAVALIDWNFAGWGDRLWDVAHAVWRSAALFDPEWLPGRFDADPQRQARRLRLYADAYGLDEKERRALLSVVRQRQRAYADGVDRAAPQDSPEGRARQRWLRNAHYVEVQEPMWTAALVA